MKVAIVHDWLTGMRGGEKVLEVLCELFPQADVYTLVYMPHKMSDTINRMNVITSPLQKFPGIERKYRYYLPLMPVMIERFNLTDYDLIISSSHCVAKGIRFKKGIRHICYCHTPMRYIWDMYSDYFGNASLPVRAVIKIFLKYLRNWDIRSSRRVNCFIANSKTVQERIKRIYDRDSIVIYPPVDTDRFYYKENEERSDYFLFVGAFAAYKRVDLVVDVFNESNEKLIIIGNGRGFDSIRKNARDNITFPGWLEDEEMRCYYARAKALIFPGLEDFGIVPVEAMACGTPVIAFEQGGATETVSEGITGTFFNEQTKNSLHEAIKRFDILKFNRNILRDHALKFSRSKFKENIIEYFKIVTKK